MIYLDLTGKLGNNLFQIYTARSLRPNDKIRITNLDYIGDWGFKSVMGLSYPGIYENYSNQEIPEDIPKFIWYGHRYKEIKDSKNEDLGLGGYFQCPLYLNRELVVNEFSEIFGKLNQDELLRKYGLQAQEFDFIGFRRGDFVGHELYDLCKPDWYKTSYIMAGMGNRPIAIFSDDIDWCKSVIPGSQNLIIIENCKPVEQLFLMSKAKNCITPNSTFSWWGAYLREKPGITVAPKLWVNYEYPREKWMANVICPEDWTIIPN